MYGRVIYSLYTHMYICLCIYTLQAPCMGLNFMCMHLRLYSSRGSVDLTHLSTYSWYLYMHICLYNTCIERCMNHKLKNYPKNIYIYTYIYIYCHKYQPQDPKSKPKPETPRPLHSGEFIYDVSHIYI